MRTHFFFCILFLSSPLLPHQVTIKSGHASCYPSAAGARFIHLGGVTTTSPTLGQLTSKTLALDLTKKACCQQITARHVTLKKKNSILTAQRLVIRPQSHTAHASGTVILTTLLPNGQRLCTHAPHAHINLMTNHIHTWTTTNTAVTTNITHDNQDTSSQPGTGTKNSSR